MQRKMGHHSQHMKNLKTRLREHSKLNNVTQHVIEQDYLLSWLLEAFSENSLLSDTLVFKGGTALKKCYFKNYRFSEDLDFTAKDGAPENAQLEDAIRHCCSMNPLPISTPKRSPMSKP